MYFLVAFTRH